MRDFNNPRPASSSKMVAQEAGSDISDIGGSIPIIVQALRPEITPSTLRKAITDK